MAIKITIGIFLVLPVLAHLAYAVVNSPITDYYVTVDQFMAGSGVTPVRVAGQIVPGSIKWDNASRTMQFQVAGDKTTLQVVFRGTTPDAFRDSATAILEGTRGSTGLFQATRVMIKCPHQYLPAG